MFCDWRPLLFANRGAQADEMLVVELVADLKVFVGLAGRGWAEVAGKGQSNSRACFCPDATEYKA